MSKQRPSIFIGSSSEGLTIAEAIQLNLDLSCETIIWSQGLFGLSGGTLESLIIELPKFDFAILVLTPDDLTESRNINSPAPRDNVLFELGLCLGVLGRERTFIVYDRGSNLKLPSDLAGVTCATYQYHEFGTLQSSLGAASTIIKRTIEKYGLRANHKSFTNKIFNNAEKVIESSKELLTVKLYYVDSVASKAIAIKKIIEEQTLAVVLDLMDSGRGSGDALVLYYYESENLDISMNLYEKLKGSGVIKVEKANWVSTGGDFVMWVK